MIQLYKTHYIVLTQAHVGCIKRQSWTFSWILKSSMTDQKQILKVKNHQWTPPFHLVVVSIHLDLHGERLMPREWWRPATSSFLTWHNCHERSERDDGASMWNYVSTSSARSLYTPSMMWGLQVPYPSPWPPSSDSSATGLLILAKPHPIPPT